MGGGLQHEHWLVAAVVADMLLAPGLLWVRASQVCGILHQAAQKG